MAAQSLTHARSMKEMAAWHVIERNNEGGIAGKALRRAAASALGVRKRLKT